jgi:hypothetical protein
LVRKNTCGRWAVLLTPVMCEIAMLDGIPALVAE